MILGWQIWKTDFMIEAEFHSVWESPDGNLIDITPKETPTKKILFLPDINAEYNGIQVENKRLNISGSPLVDDFIEINKAMFRLKNKGNLKNQHGVVHLYGKDSELFMALDAMKLELYKVIKKVGSRNSPCFCGRGMKYKHCHGKDIKKALPKI